MKDEMKIEISIKLSSVVFEDAVLKSRLRLGHYRFTTKTLMSRKERQHSVGREMGIDHASEESKSSDNRMRYNIFGILCLSETTLRNSETGIPVHASESIKASWWRRQR